MVLLWETYSQLGGFATPDACATQSLLELLDNASDASQRGLPGDVSIRAELTPLDGLRSPECSGFIARVQDTGRGIPREKLPQLLGRMFASTKDSRRSFGADENARPHRDDSSVSAGKFGVGVKLALLAAAYHGAGWEVSNPEASVHAPGSLRVTTACDDTDTVAFFRVDVSLDAAQSRGATESPVKIMALGETSKPESFRSGTCITMAVPGSWVPAFVETVCRMTLQYLSVPLIKATQIIVNKIPAAEWAAVRRLLPEFLLCDRERAPISVRWLPDDDSTGRGDGASRVGPICASVEPVTSRSKPPSPSIESWWADVLAQPPQHVASATELCSTQGWLVEVAVCIVLENQSPHRDGSTDDTGEWDPSATQLMAPEGVQLLLLRYANDVPLMHDGSLCGLTRAVAGKGSAWESMGLRVHPDSSTEKTHRTADEDDLPLPPRVFGANAPIDMSTIPLGVDRWKLQPASDPGQRSKQRLKPPGPNVDPTTPQPASAPPREKFWKQCVVAVHIRKTSSDSIALPFRSIRKQGIAHDPTIRSATQRALEKTLRQLKKSFPLLFLSAAEHAVRTRT